MLHVILILTTLGHRADREINLGTLSPTECVTSLPQQLAAQYMAAHPMLREAGWVVKAVACRAREEGAA